MAGDQGENFSLSLKVDGRYSGRRPSIQSEVVSLGNIVWLPKINHATGANKNVFNVEVSESSSLTFELKRGCSSQVSSLRQNPIACFSTTAHDMFSQRKSSSGLDVMQLRESRSNEHRMGSRLLHVYWEILPPATRSGLDVDNCDSIVPRQPPAEIYSQLLLGFGRGTPLWTPGCPLLYVPQSYKRNGLDIGDIGIISPLDGIFEYEFNIFHSPGHEENPDDLPDDLLCPGVVPDVLEYDEEREVLDNHVQGTATCADIDSPTPGYTMCASKWAILGVPNGSKSRYAVNSPVFSSFLEARGEALYKYLLEKRGPDLKNGDVCLVTGWTKANSWGMAAFEDPNSPPQPCTLKFDKNQEIPSIPQYWWKSSEGFVQIQSGPILDDIRSLREELEDDMDVQQRVNQCLFVKTASLTIQGSRWNEILHKVGYSTELLNPDRTESNTVFRDCMPERQRSELLSGLGAQYPSHWFDTNDRNPSKAIGRCLLAMTPSANLSTSSDMDWTPISRERGAFLPTSEPNIPYILSRLLELNEICQKNGSVSLRPRDVGIPSILVYLNSSKPGLSARIRAKTSYSKVKFVENLDQADVWILELDGRLHGRIVHWLSFRHTPEPLLSVAFAQILPVFRFLLQLGGILQVYIKDSSLIDLQKSSEPEVTWYSLSRDSCSICDQAILGGTVKQKDFGGLVLQEQKILPLGRDAVNILSRHFNSLSASLLKDAPSRNDSNLKRSEISEVPHKVLQRGRALSES